MEAERIGVARSQNDRINVVSRCLFPLTFVVWLQKSLFPLLWSCMIWALPADSMSEQQCLILALSVPPHLDYNLEVQTETFRSDSWRLVLEVQTETFRSDSWRLVFGPKHFVQNCYSGSPKPVWIIRKVYCSQGAQLDLILLDLHTVTIFFV